MHKESSLMLSTSSCSPFLRSSSTCLPENIHFAKTINQADGMDETSDATTSRAMRLDFRSILATGKHSDFIVECEGHCFKTHKAILRTASPFFQAAIEGNTKESDNNKMLMPDDHPEILARLLIFIYTGRYITSSVPRWKRDDTAPFADVHALDNGLNLPGDSKTTTETWQRTSLVAVAMYQIADKTLIDNLRWVSRSNFLASIRPDRDNESEGRRFWAEDEMKDVISIIKSVYECTRPDDWMLHDPVVHRMLVGIQDYGCLRWEPYQKLLEDVPRLAVEIATSQLAGSRQGKKCNICHKKTQQRLWRCKCGSMFFCDNEECNSLRQTRSICDTCAIFGTCI